MKRSDIKEMRALSIAQPWAHCIINEGKNIENRSWSTKYRGTFAIHASSSKDNQRFDACRNFYRLSVEPEKLAYMSIIGFVDLIDVITEETVTKTTRKWFSGEYGFVLTNIVKLKTPVKAKGALNFWKLNGENLKQCLDQLSDSQLSKFKMFDKLR
jgi:hypothetical protein